MVPSVSILAEPPVAWSIKVVDKHGTRQVAEAYLQYLYSPRARRWPPSITTARAMPKGVPEEYLKQFPKVELFTIDDVFGGWQKAQAEHFDDGGVFDQIYKPGS